MARGLSKFFKICFAGLTVLFLGIGFVKSVFFPTDISMYEQRTLDKLPAANFGVFLDNSFQSDFDTALGDQISFSTYYKKLYNELTSFADKLFLPIRHNIHGRYVTYRGSQLFNGQLVAKSESLELIKEPMLETARAINSKISALEDCEFYFYYINNDTEINFETGEKRGTYEFLRDNLILPDANCAARITHVEKMLSLLRSRIPVKVVLDVNDEIIPENNGLFLWEVSEEMSVCRKMTAAESDISVNIAELTEFVFGKREIKGLEEVKVLSRICINEAV